MIILIKFPTGLMDTWLAMGTRSKQMIEELEPAFIVQASFEAEARQLEMNKRVVDFVLKKTKEKANEKQKAG